MNQIFFKNQLIHFSLILQILTYYPISIFGQDRESSVYKSLYTNSGFLYYSGYVIEKFHDTKVINGVRHLSYTENVITGEGTFYPTYPVGSYYKGTFLNGKLHGKGIRFLDGEYSEGNWSYGKRNGMGKVWTEENYKYGAFTFEGNFVDDVKEGFGIYDCADFRYEGDFYNSQRHGRGKYIWKKSRDSGVYYIGNWVNGQRTGYGEMYWLDGSYYKGDFLNNNWNGEGENYNKKTGLIQKGNFQNNVFVEKINTIEYQVEQKSVSQTDLIKRSPSQVCNWKPSKPKLSFVLVDNRKACDCCNARYARNSVRTTTNIQSEKNYHEIEYAKAIMEKHLKNSNADDNHIESDNKKFSAFVSETYGMSLVTMAQTLFSGYMNMLTSMLGGDPLKDTQKKINRFDIESDYCSNLCQNRCY